MLDPDYKLCVKHGQDTLKGAFDPGGNDGEVFLEGGRPSQAFFSAQSFPEPMSYLNQNQVWVQDQVKGENCGEQRGRKGPRWGRPQRTGAQVFDIFDHNCVEKTGLWAGLQDAVFSGRGLHQHIHSGVIEQASGSFDDTGEKELSGWVGVEEIDSKQTKISI